MIFRRITVLLALACLSAHAQTVLLGRQRQERRPVAAAGGFNYHATQFDTSSYLTRSGGLSGLSDGKTFTLSFWVKMVAADNVEAHLFDISAATGNDGLRVYRRNDGYLAVFAYSGVGTVILDSSSYTNTIRQADGWTHLLIKVNMASGILYYKNGVEQHYSNTLTDANINFDTSVNCYVGWNCNVFGNCRLSEVWFNTGTTPVYSDFVSAGKPKDLTALGTPLLYLPNAYGSFQTNSGSGGNFTVTGTLIDSDSDKP